MPLKTVIKHLPGQHSQQAHAGGHGSGSAAAAEANKAVMADLKRQFPEYKGKTGEKEMLAQLAGASTREGGGKGLKYNPDGSIEFRHSYFYSHGNTPEKWGAKVVAELESKGFQGAQVNSTSNEYATWPKTSYFMANVTIPGINEK